MFEVTGTLAGRRRTVQWDAGELDGDPTAIEEVRLLIGTGRQLPLTATGPSVAAALDPPAAALRTIVEAFAPGSVTVRGDVPDLEIPALPDDAIG
jgi:hypothetical protein